jgi:hypothetical protein
MTWKTLVTKNFIFLSLLLAVILIAGCVTSQPEENILALPNEAIKLSEVVPGMGEHWAIPSDLPFGPIYLVHEGKIIGIEYMIHEDELESNPITLPSGEVIGRPFIMSTLGQKINHVELNYLPQGHAGDEEPHYDLHMYFISKEGREQIK